MDQTRRRLLIATGALPIAIASTRLLRAADDEATFPLELSPAEWRKRLSEEEFEILREAGTESRYSSPLLEEERPGTFVCAGCGQDAYAAATKYDSGTGWPSFWAPLDGAIGTKPDPGLFGTRTEVHCSRCGGHHGHVFADGPQPTGKRYCINGLALGFRPATG